MGLWVSGWYATDIGQSYEFRTVELACEDNVHLSADVSPKAFVIGHFVQRMVKSAGGISSEVPIRISNATPALPARNPHDSGMLAVKSELSTLPMRASASAEVTATELQKNESKTNHGQGVEEAALEDGLAGSGQHVSASPTCPDAHRALTSPCESAAGRSPLSPASSKELQQHRPKLETLERRFAEMTGPIMSLPDPPTSIFVRPRKRVRLRPTVRGFAPLYHLVRGEDAAALPMVCALVWGTEAALRAAEGGAARVELAPCTSGELRAACTALARCAEPTSVFAHLAVPNGTDWRLSAWDKAALRVEVQLVKSLSASGVVLGALGDDGSLDTPFLERIVRWARPLKVYVCRDAFETAFASGARAAIDGLCAVGVHGVYATFGPTAWAGKDDLARAVRLAQGRLNVVAQGSVTVDNALKLAACTHVSHVLLGGITALNDSGPDCGVAPAPRRLQKTVNHEQTSPALATGMNMYTRARPTSFVGTGAARSSTSRSSR